MDGATFTLTDLGSTNHTFVNSVRVESVQLRDGDKIQVGGSVLKFVILDDLGNDFDAVKQAAETEGTFDDWFLDDDSVLTASADDRLCGGETEEEFAQRLAKAIWAANGDYCRVEVNATYLDQLPYETHCLDEDDYRRLVAPPGGRPSA